MNKTKINGNPGFGIPSDIGANGDRGNNIYFATLLCDIIKDEDKYDEIGKLDSSLPFITHEYYNGRKYAKDASIVYYKILNKDKDIPFKSGDTIIINLDRCSFFNVILDSSDSKAFIENTPKYKFSLSPTKYINSSFSAALSADDKKTILLYPSVTIGIDDLIHCFHVEIIHGTTSKNYSFTLTNFNSEYVEIKLPDNFPSNQSTAARINIYAVCKTHTMGMKEYYIGNCEVGI